MNHNILQNAIYDGLLKSWESASGSRSSKRTDLLHKSFEHYLKKDFAEMFKNTTFLHEKKVSTSNGHFKIDICCEKNGVSTAFLLKLITSSYNKNRYNYANTTIGESFRFLTNFKDRKLAHINFIPEKTVAFDKHNKIKAVQNSNIQETDYFYNAVGAKNVFFNDPIGCDYVFIIDEEVFKGAATRKDLHENLKRTGPAAIKFKNFQENKKKLYDFLNKGNNIE